MFSDFSPNNAIKAVRGKIVGQADSWMQVMKEEESFKKAGKEWERSQGQYVLYCYPAKQGIYKLLL